MKTSLETFQACRQCCTKCPLCDAAPLCPGCSQQVGAQEGEWVDKVVGEIETRPPSQGFTPQVQAVLPLLA